ncbi:MAG: 3-hydroxyacyl-CoA dehydrogenase NAD-binding domain-containing protein [Devosiaceae bacterium]
MITVLGAGSIGVAFAAVFSDMGVDVTIVEPNAQRRGEVDQGLRQQDDAIWAADLWRGGQGKVDVVAEADGHVAMADLVLECGPEKLDVKQAIFADLLEKAGEHTLLATASSAITISQIVPDNANQARCLVAHPVNPPSVLRVIELVPAPGTDAQAMARAGLLFEQAGFHPVQLGKEIEGFVLNRLQGAVLREAYRLVADGVSDVAGVEAIVRLGLGPRWALSGPFETAELNTPGGIMAHAQRMGPAYKRMGEARGETVDWNDELVATVAAQCRAQLPEDAIPARAAWRAKAVAELVAQRNILMQQPQLPEIEVANPIDTNDNEHD